MGKIIDPEGGSGVTMFLNANIKSYLSIHTSNEEKSTELFKKSFYDEKIEMHVGSIENDKLQIIAMRQDGKKMYFELGINSDLQVSSISKINQEKLTVESKTFIEELNSQYTRKITPQ